MTVFKLLIKLEWMRKGVMSIRLPHEGCPAVDLIHPSMFITQKRQIRHIEHTLVQTRSNWW